LDNLAPHSIQTPESDNAVTVFCFVCQEEKFRPEIAKSGYSHRRQQHWYLCRECKKAWVDSHPNKQIDGWIKTQFGYFKQGPHGVPSHASLRERKRNHRFIGPGRGDSPSK
jgi:hypothetical protein